MNTMTFRFFLWVFVAFLSGTAVFGVGVYNSEGDFTHFVNNAQPNINITIKDTTIPVNIKDAKLRVNTQSDNVSIDYQLLPNTKWTYNFTFADFFTASDEGIANISAADEVYFQLAITPAGSSGEVRLQGDPVKFFIQYDDTDPTLLSPDDETFTFSGDSLPLNFNFDEKISEYEVFINGTSVKHVTPESRFYDEYQSSASVNLSSDDVVEGENDFRIVARDMAGNVVSSNRTINYVGEPLSVELVTKRENSTLSYFYSAEHPDLFGETIYTDSTSFTLTLRSSEPAKCYFSDNRLSFGTIGEVTQQENMTASDDLLHHSIDVSFPEGQQAMPIWAACRSTADAEDVVYLHEMAGVDDETLMNVGYYDEPAVEITSFYPENLITSMPFSVQAFTNVKAACEATVPGTTKRLAPDSSMTNHEATGMTTEAMNPEYSMTCMDRLYRNDTRSRTLEVDMNAGVQITEYQPDYLSSGQDEISLTLSESADCRYSLDPVPQTQESMDALPSAKGSGINRHFNVSGLDEGENVIHLYCIKNGNVNPNEITVTYDPDGPSLSNLTFETNGVTSDYLGSTEEMGISFDVDSLIPMSQFHVELVYADKTIDEKVPSAEATIVRNLSGLQSVRVIGENEAGVNSSPLQKPVQFDMTPPQLFFSEVSSSSMEVSCSDAQSGCSEVRYGLSQDSLSCTPGTTYENNETIDTSDSGYICAEAYDKVRNRQTAEKLLTSGVDDGSYNDSLADNATENATDFVNETQGDGSEDEPQQPPEEPFEPEPSGPSDSEDDGNVSLIIAAAIFLVLAGVGSGGYYAYRKGYLNDQLQRMGLIQPPKKQQGSTPSYQSQRNAQQQANQATRNAYDEHVRRLNRFLDSTLSKGKDLFSKFEDNSKGKHEAYDDTLMKRSKKDDAFYASSKKGGKKTEDLTSSGKTVAEEAEDFESYYKKKKQNHKKES